MKLRLPYLPLYLLVLSLFTGNFLFQYMALAVFLLFYLIGRPSLRKNVFLLLPLILVTIVVLSYGYNLFTGLADVYSILFWFFSYFPPILLMWIIMSYKADIEFTHVYSFYKKLVYLQSFLLIYSAFQHRTFVVGDPATGTLGDANWVAFHICVVLIYEIARVITLSKSEFVIFRNRFTSILEIFYFFIVLIIPESTANLGFLLIVLSFFFFNEYILAKINIVSILVFVVCAALGYLILKDTFVFRRIETTILALTKDPVEKDYNFFKLTIYRKILSGTMYETVNPVIGSGPATFTSRSSVVRMPEERVNDFPIPLPYFKNSVFSTYISPAYADWRESGESYGNFASPQSTVISVAIELGLAGLLWFGLFFFSIAKKLRSGRDTPEIEVRKKFARYLTFFFVLSLFHLDFWEYPIICFTYITFTFLTIRRLSQSSGAQTGPNDRQFSQGFK